MIKTIKTIGNSQGLIVERPILDLLKIYRGTALEVTTDGRSLTFTPIDEERRNLLEKIAKAGAKTKG